MAGRCSTDSKPADAPKRWWGQVIRVEDRAVHEETTVAGNLVTASGDSSVAAGGDVNRSAISTGDGIAVVGHIVNMYRDAGARNEADYRAALDRYLEWVRAHRQGGAARHQARRPAGGRAAAGRRLRPAGGRSIARPPRDVEATRCGRARANRPNRKRRARSPCATAGPGQAPGRDRRAGLRQDHRAAAHRLDTGRGTAHGPTGVGR